MSESDSAETQPSQAPEPEIATKESSASAASVLIRRLPILLVAVIIVLLLVFTTIPGITVFAAVISGYLIFWVGLFFLRQFATPPPPPPDPGTLRKVRLTYLCPSCGTEVRMTSAATEDPEPPRHCMEDMELVTTEL